MHLDKLYQLYLEQAKNRVLSFPDNDRARICQWIKVIEQSPNPDEEVRKKQLHSLKLLLLCLESNLFSEPFENNPEQDKNFTEYKWDSFDLDEYSDMIRARRRNCSTPNTSYTVSGNRRRLMTYQNNPQTGQHCYYASSNDPVERWDNLRGGAVQDESIKEWSGLGDYEELNSKVSRSSFDIPRCDPAPTTEPTQDFCPANQAINRTQTPTRCVLPQNSPRPPPRSPQLARPQTPQRFGGRGPRYQSYAPAQFGLSPSEQFRSPRGVFENLEYESPNRPRFTDEIIAELDAARRRYASPVPTESETRAQLCSRLQKVREGMNRRSSGRAQVPEVTETADAGYQYEPITLQEPVDECARDQSDLGILSEQEMNLNDSIFGDQLMQSRAERSIAEQSRAERSRDDSLVSRNVKKISTDTRIQSGQRQVTEEILEEEINVEPPEPPVCENLMDVSQPSFLRSPPVLSPSPVCENLMDVSEPSFHSPPGFSPLRLSERVPCDIRRTYRPRRLFNDSGDRSQVEYSRERLDSITMPSFASTPSRSGRQEYSEILDDVCQPEFVSFEDSAQRNTGRRLPDVEMTENLDLVSEPFGMSSIRDISMSPVAPRRTPPPCRPLPTCDISERLDDVSDPGFASPAERLIDVMSPSFLTGPRQRSRISPRPLPQVVATEWLDDVCEPEYASEADIDVAERIDDVTAPEFDSIVCEPISPIERPLPNPETSERLDSVCEPSFHSSFDTSSPARQKLLSRVYDNEFLDDVSQPAFPESFNVSSIHETSRPFDPTERLSDVCQPSFPESFESSRGSQRRRTPLTERPLPTCPITERLDDVGQPEFQSFESSFDHNERLSDVCQPSFPESLESSRGSQRRRTPLTERPLPVCPITENLDDVGQPEFQSFESSFDPNERLSDVNEPSWPESLESSRGSKWRRTPLTKRPLPTCPITERLSDVGQPEFPESFETTFDPNERLSDVCEPSWHASLDSSRGSQRRRTPLTERPLPTCPITERLSDVCEPQFPESFETTFDPNERLSDVCEPSWPDSSRGSQRRRTPLTERPLPTCPITERLSDVCEPQFPESFETTFDHNERLSDVCEPSWPDSSRGSQRRRTPLTERPLPTCPITERLSDVCEPQFPESFETTFDHNERLSDVCEPSWPDSSRGSQRRRTPLTERPLPTCPITERLSDVCEPQFPESFETTFDHNERLSDVCEPSWPDSSRGSQRKRTPLTERPLPTCPITERLSDVCEPQFPDSFETTFDPNERLSDVCEPSWPDSSRGSQRRRTPLTERPLPTCPITERLSDVCEPQFPESFETTFDPNERLSDVCEPSWPDSSRGSQRRRTPLTERPLPTCPITERLSDVCEPQFPESFETTFDHNERLSDVCEPSWPDSSRGSQRRRTPLTERPLPTCPITERLSDVCEPQFPESFETTFDPNERLSDVCEPSWPASLDSSRGSQRRRTPLTERPLPTCPITERLSDVCEPQFPESFETTFDHNERLSDVCEPSWPDSSRGSQRRRTPLTERPLPTCPITERLSDVCEPQFPESFETTFDHNERLSDVCEPSWPDSSRGSQRRRTPLTERPLPTCPITERLSDVCEPQFPESFETTFDHNERLSDVCEPSWPDSSRGSQRRRTPLTERPLPTCPITERLSDVGQPQFPESFETTFDPNERLSDVCEPSWPDSSRGSQRRRTPLTERPLPTCPITERLSDVGQPEFQSFESSFDHNERLSDVCQPSFPESFDSSRGSRRSPARSTPQRRTPPNYKENLDDVSMPSFPSTPVATPRDRPQRQLFPRDNRRSPFERPGDYREAFQTLANYAPFEEQVRPRPRTPLAQRLKYQIRSEPQTASRMKPPEMRVSPNAAAGSRMPLPPSGRTPGPSTSGTRIPPPCGSRMPLPPSGRTPGPATSASKIQPPGVSRMPLPPSSRCPGPATSGSRIQPPGGSRMPLPPSSRTPCPSTSGSRIQPPGGSRMPLPPSCRSPGPATSGSRIQPPGGSRMPLPPSCRSPGPSTSGSRIQPPSRSRTPIPPASRSPGPSTSGTRIPPPCGSRMPLPPSARNAAQAGSRLAAPPSGRGPALSSTLRLPAPPSGRTPGQAISCPRMPLSPSGRTPGQAITGSRMPLPPSARTPGQAMSSSRMPLPPSARCPANAQQLQPPRLSRSPGPSTSRSRLPAPPSARCPANAQQQQLQLPRSARSPAPSTSRSRLPLPPSARCPANAQQQQLQVARSARSPGPSTSRSRLPPPPSARCPANTQGQPKSSTKPNDGERLVKKSSVKFTRTTSTFAKDQPGPSNLR